MLLIGVALEAQHLIGFSKNEVTEKVENWFPDLYLNTSTVNKAFDYFKYEDNSRTKTLLVFFNDEGVSSFSKLMCDYSLYPEIVDSLNHHYTSTGKNRWQESSLWNEYEIELVKQEWFFTVKTTKK